MKKKILIIAAIVILVGAAGAFLYNDYSSRIYLQAETEAGTPINVDDFKRRKR